MNAPLMAEPDSSIGARPPERPQGRSGASILQIEELAKAFGGILAVQALTLHAEQGQITSVIGPNGAGKTTLFNLITGVYRPDAGRILFHANGTRHDLIRRPPDAICRLGIGRTFQNVRLFPDLSVEDNVKVGLHHRSRAGVWSALLHLPRTRREERAVRHAARRHLAFCGLAERAAQPAAGLPYGDRKRLEIARALATDPSLLLLDEPAAGLNPAETESLMVLLRRVRDAGVTILLIEHDMRLVMGISDHVWVMDHGVLLAHGTVEQVQRDARVIEAYLGTGLHAPGTGAPTREPVPEEGAA